MRDILGCDLTEEDIAGRQESNRFAWPIAGLSLNEYRRAFWRLAIPDERTTRAYVRIGRVKNAPHRHVATGSLRYGMRVDTSEVMP